MHTAVTITPLLTREPPAEVDDFMVVSAMTSVLLLGATIAVGGGPRTVVEVEEGGGWTE